MSDLRDDVHVIDCPDWRSLSKEFEALSYSKPRRKASLWIYRGEGSDQWWLKPSIERFIDSLGGEPARVPSIQDIENQLLFDFKSSAGQFLANLPSEDQYLEWLAVLQHHGAPTRLLDWSYSPTVAAYFALRALPQGNSNACVWALNLTRLKEKLLQDGKDFENVHAEFAGPKVQNSGIGLIYPFLPRHRYSRMSGQQGLFLVNVNSGQPFMQTLQAMAGLQDKSFLRRLIIPRSARISVLGHLLEHNTHEVGLFPDAEGLGRFVRIKAEIQIQTLGLL